MKLNRINLTLASTALSCLLSLGSLRAEYETEMLEAAENEQWNTVKKYIEAGKTDINAQDKDGDTALIIAAMSQEIDMIKYLVEREANLNIQPKGAAHTALHWAAFDGHLDIAKYLTEHGASLTPKNKWNRTPLQQAQKFNRTAVVDYLTMVTDYYAARTNKTVSDFLGTLTKEQLQDVYNIAYNQKHYDVLKEEQFKRRLNYINKKNEFNTNTMNFKFV